MENAREGVKIFDATLALEREEIRAGTLARALAQYPLMTLKVMAAIHWQAVKLWLRGAKIYPHPDRSRSETER